MVYVEGLKRQGRVRSGGRAGRKAQRSTKNKVKVVQAGMSGGAYKTLKDTDLKIRILRKFIMQHWIFWQL